MIFRDRLFVSTVILGFVALAAKTALAGLLNAGATVLTDYYPGTNAPANQENENIVSFGSPDPVSLANPISYNTEGADDGSTIVVGNTSITITNLLPFTFCGDGASVGPACNDSIDGFKFLFTGENILGATVDPASSAGFTPATFGIHNGLDLIDKNDLLVDLTGADPAVNGTLTIDLTFTETQPPPPPLPEPASLGLFSLALGGVVATRRRRRKHA
jgi:hypothetical protein